MAMRWHWPPLNSCGRRHRCCVPRPTISSRERTRASQLPAAQVRLRPERLGDQVVHGHARVERRVGVLEDHLGVAHHLAALARAAGRTGPGRGTRMRAAGRLDQLQDGAGDRGLAAPRLAHQRQRLALGRCANETSSTACTMSIDFLPRPRRMWKWTVRSSTSSRLTTPPRGRAARVLPAAQKQETQCGRPPAPAAAWRVGHTSSTCLQRGWKRQPVGGVDEVGHRPGDGLQLRGRVAVRQALVERDGVGVARRGLSTSTTGPSSTTAAGVHHGDAVAGLRGDADVVRDDHLGDAQLARAA